MGSSETSPSPEKLAELFEKRWSNGKHPEAFYEFLRSIEGLAENKTARREQIAQAIAGTVFVPGVDADPLREEITIVAGDLETGRPQSKHSWEYLLALTDELGQQLGR